MLPGQNRLKKDQEFQKVYKFGSRIHTPYFTLLFLHATQTKIGIVVSKKIGKATVRNKIKRRLREIFREQLPYIEHTIHIVLITKPSIITFDYHILKQHINSALTKAKLMKQGKVSQRMK